MDLVHRKAYRFEGGTEVEIPIPDDLADEVAKRRDQLLEAAAEADDAVFEKYLGEEEISDAELDACLHKGVRESILAPVLVTSAARGIGLGALLDAIVRYLPSPDEEGPYAATDKAGKDVSVAADGGQLLVRVFKTAADPFVGRLTYLRVLSGTLKSQGGTFNSTKGEDERIGQLLYLHGKEQEPAAELRAGEIGAVAKLGVTETGDTLSSRELGLRLAPMEFPEPTLQVAIDPVSKGDLDKMGPALTRMLEEEPTARVERSDTGEQILRAIGEAHVAVICERLKRKFGAAIATRTPKVPYRETIRGTTKSHGRYKKQTGGHGMFGDVWIELEPNPAAGVEFAEKVVGGSVPKGFFAGIEKGIRETAAEGVLAGYPLIDFRATLVDGSFHPVDSNELSFKIAASMALKDGILQATPGAPRADHDRRGPDPGAVHGRGQPGPQRPPRAGAGHGPGGRHADHQCARPPVGAVLVRDGAAVPHGRPRDVQLGAGPLRGRAGAPGGEGDRGPQEGATPRGSLSGRPGRGPAGDWVVGARRSSTVRPTAVIGGPASRLAGLSLALGLAVGACGGAPAPSPSGQAALPVPRCEDLARLEAPVDWYRPQPVYVANEMPVDAVRAWAETRPGFQELWIDRDRQGWISVGFTDGVEARQAELLAAFPDAGVVAVEVPHTAAELDAIQASLQPAWRDLGIVMSSAMVSRGRRGGRAGGSRPGAHRRPRPTVPRGAAVRRGPGPGRRTRGRSAGARR